MTDRVRLIEWEDPHALAEVGQGLSGIEFLEKLISRQLPPPPFATLLNFELTEISDGRAVFICEPGEYHYNPIGLVHGGLAATLLDSAMGCAIHSTLPAGVGYTTLEIKVNFIRALTAGSGIVRCEANVIHSGGRTATAEGKVFNARGQLCAHGTTTCLVMRR